MCGCKDTPMVPNQQPVVVTLSIKDSITAWKACECGPAEKASWASEIFEKILKLPEVL